MTTATARADLSVVKARQQKTWASGDYAVIASRIVLASELLADAADLQAGWEVLDVACGNGNATLAAARSSTHALGVDYVPAGRATLERALAGEDIYLKADGHWSPHGCDAVAQELVEWTRTRHPELTADR